MAVIVAKLPVTNLDDDEAIDLGTRLSGALKDFDGNHAWFSLVRAELDANILTFGKVRARDRASELTKKIRAKDAERDELLKRIDSKCVYLAGEPAPAEKAAAGRVLAAMDNRGLPNSDMGDSDQSVHVNELLTDFKGASLAADIVLIELTDVVAALTQAQQEFEDLIAARAAEQSTPEEEKLPATREVRQHLLDALDVVRNDLVVALRRDPATYSSVAAVASGHIEEIVAKARARRTREAGSDVPGQPATV